MSSLLKHILILSFAILSLLAQPPAASAREDPAPLQQVRLKLKWMHAFQFAGYYAAQTKGYYREEGLDVVIEEASPGSAPMEFVLSGRAEYGVACSELLMARLSGEPVVALAVIFQHSPNVILTRRDSGIDRPSDLVGRKAGVWARPELDAEFWAMIRNEGIAQDALTTTPYPWNVLDIIAGRVDAGMVYITNEPRQMRKYGVEPGIIQPADYGVDFYGDALFTSEHEIRDHPERAAAFRGASLKGWEYAMAHEEEMIAFILTLPGVRERGLEAGDLRYEAKEMRKLILPDLVEMGHINPGRWRRMAETLAELGLTGPDFNLKGFIYEPDPPKSRTWIAVILAVLCGVGLVALAEYVWNRRLRAAVKSQMAELQQSREDLLESRNFLNEIINAAGDPIFVKNRRYEWVLLNDALCRFVGRTREELLGKSDYDFFPREEADVCWETDEVVFQTGHENINEEAITDASGAHKWIITKKVLYKDPVGRQFIVGVIRDITERKRAEEELEKSQAMLAAAIKQSPSGIIIVEAPDMAIRLINPAALNILGQPGMNFTGAVMEPPSDMWNIFHPDGVTLIDPDKRPLERAVKHGVTSQNEEVLLQNSSREFRWISANAAPIRDKKGEIISGIVIFHDITERKRAEEALEKSQAMLAAAIEQSPSGIIIADAPDMAIRLINPAGLNILDLPGKDFTRAVTAPPSDTWNIFHPDGVTLIDPDKRPLERAVKYGATLHNEEVVLQNSRGDLRWISANAAPIRNRDGGIVAGIAVIQDITSQKKAEEVMIQSEKMMSVGRLTAGMAHEINNPLAGIIQNAQVALLRLSPEGPKNQEAAQARGISLNDVSAYLESRGVPRMIQAVLDSGLRAASIVENMLSFSRKSNAYLSVQDVVRLLDDAVELAATDYDLKKHYDFKHIQVIRDYQSPLPNILCDANRLQQVFLNLLTNAAHALAAQGEKAGPPTIRLTAKDDGDALKIIIEDNGPGIPQDAQKKVFEPFFTTKPPGVGTGLGLYVSYSLVTEAHGGSMHLESEPGQGAAFIIRLPKNPSKTT